MKQFISLDDVLKFNDTYFVGDCFYTFANKKQYPFIKGMLEYSPRKFQHPLYNVKKDHTATYIVREMYSGNVYVGSSEKVYDRIARHKWHILRKQHSNSKFTELLQQTHIKNFDLIVIFTETREEAYDLEQYFVNMYKDTGLLINIAEDVRLPMRGCKLTEEHRQKISEANTGKIMSEEAKQKISYSRQSSEKAQLQIHEMISRKRRRILVNGIEYESLTQASQLSGMSLAMLRSALADNDPKVIWLSNNESPIKGRVLSEEHRRNLSISRKNNPKAKQQLESIRELTRRKIILNGVLYNSVLEASKAVGIGECTIHRKLREHKDKFKDGPYVLDYVKHKQ